MSSGVTNIDSVTKYYEYVEKAKECGMKAFAFSEHGSVFEWVHKKERIESAGMKYIHAEEFYLTEKLYHYPDVPDDVERELQSEYLEKNKFKVRDNFHCVLIARNYDGVKELNRLSSKAFNREDGSFYYAPRITFEDLFNTSDNIIVTSACIGGVLNKGGDQQKRVFLKFFIHNKHRCFLEVQHHNTKDQIEYNKKLYTIHKKFGIPLIAGTDTHALNEEHIKGRKILQEAKGVHFDSEDGWDMVFKTYDQLVTAYKMQNALPEQAYLNAIENTNIMADMVSEFTLDRSRKYPQLYKNPEKVFKQKIIEGVKSRGVAKYPNYNEYKLRIGYELKTYKHNDAINFMLLEEDYKKYLREKENILPGYSRGSVSGSEIAYLLHITEVDSIKYSLNFERFMNTERISLADIDSDWFKEDIDHIRDYLYQKEGLYCCDIITFNTVKMKGAIKEVGRALGYTAKETQRISDAVEQDENKKWVIDDTWRKKYPDLFYYVDIIDGVIVSVGNHPAGVVISPFSVDDWFGVFSTKSNNHFISQINMKEIDSLNFVKLDVLGLDCVGLINKTCELANIPRLTPDNMDFDDMKVWNSIREDYTMIFQFESDSSGAYIKQLFSDQTIARIREINPNFSYIDLMSMANGAIRPAGKSYRDELANGIYKDNGHVALNEFLKDTLGYLVYQEQIIEFLHSFCGYTMGEADIVRRAFSKKTGTETHIPKIKDGFIKTMGQKYNVSADEANKLVESFLQVIIDASDYLFSRNHAIPYSMLGYAVAWLRYYYPLELLTAALNVYQEDATKSAKIKQYAEKLNIQIRGIRFGYSKAEYFMDKKENVIYQGIESIKYCNAAIADELMDLANSDNYTNFDSLLHDIKSKTSVDARQIEILVMMNFFSKFGKNKFLMGVVNIYNKFGTIKQISKSKLDDLGIDEFTAKKYSGKETPKLFKDINNQGLIKALCGRLKNEEFGAIESIKFQKDKLNYVTYQNDTFPKNVYIVTDLTVYKSSTRPYLILRRIKTGENVKCRIKSSQVFKNDPFKEYSVLLIDGFSYEKKRRKVGEERVVTDEEDIVLKEYEVIK